MKCFWHLAGNCYKRGIELLCLLAVLPLASCTKQIKPSADDGGVRITATFYPIYIMCLNITCGVEGVSLSCLAPPSAGCLHDYSLTARDAAEVENADVIVANGAGMESFLGRILETKLDKVIVSAEGYPLIDGNPHIFVSVSGARYQVKTIASGLSRLDSAHADEYAANAAKYDEALAALSGEMHTALDRLGCSMVTFHEAFPYFAAEFGFDILSVVEHEPGTAPSARDIAQTVRIIREDIDKGHTPMLFAEPQYPVSSAKIIEAETHLVLHTLDPCVTGAMTQDAYIQAQRKNVASILSALNPIP